MPKPAPAATAEQRDAARFDTAMAVRIGDAPAHVRNISDSGVYFETELPHEVGAPVRFTVEFTQHGQRRSVLCEGEVVRVDKVGERIGVAARLAKPFFDAAEDVVVRAVERKRA